MSKKHATRIGRDSLFRETRRGLLRAGLRKTTQKALEVKHDLQDAVTFLSPIGVRLMK